MHLRAGRALDCPASLSGRWLRRKSKIILSRKNQDSLKEIFSNPDRSIPGLRPPPQSHNRCNFLATSGNGRPAATCLIRDSSRQAELWVNTTENSCVTRWFYAAAPV